MKVKKYRLEAILTVIIFVCAIFNDILRIPYTVVSFFRLLLPLAMLISLVNFSKVRNFLVFIIFFLVASVGQNLVYVKILEYENVIDVRTMVRYDFFYLCIIALFMLMHIMKNNDVELYEKIFYTGVPIIGVICMVLYVMAVFEIPDYIDNRNNYACYLAVVFPWFMIQALKKDYKYVVLCLLIIIELLYGDSKSVLMGVLMQIGLLGSMMISKKIKNGWKAIYVLIPIVACALIAFVLSPITINGYSIREMFTQMIVRILRNDVYPESATSLVYRTNSYIYLLRTIFQTYFLGIGPGNSAKMLAHAMSGVAKAKHSTILSPHNAWLEFISDCGIWALLLLVIAFGVGLKMLFKSRGLNEDEMYLTTFIISFPMWSISASGLYTTYFIFIVIAWMFEHRKRRI